MNIDLELRNMVLLTEAETVSLSQLRITEWQEIKGGSFSESVEAWREAPAGQVLGLCFLLARQPVGMTLFKRPPLSPKWATPRAATIHGLKITQPLQGRGLGHKAFDMAVQYLKEMWPDAETLMLAVDADNNAALAVYRSYGMVDSGISYEGSNGREYRFSMSLA